MQLGYIICGCDYLPVFTLIKLQYLMGMLANNFSWFVLHHLPLTNGFLCDYVIFLYLRADLNIKEPLEKLTINK